MNSLRRLGPFAVATWLGSSSIYSVPLFENDAYRARFLEPMLLLATGSLPEGNDWEYELKLDGYRAIAFNSDGKVRLRSRNNKDFALRYPAMAKALGNLPDQTVIDGEIVAFDESGLPSFNTLQNYGSSTLRIFHYASDVPITDNFNAGTSSNG
jgi:ATP-dependent DNA ligase